MLGDFAVLNGTEQLFIFLMPLVSSLALLGQVKAALVINGPLTVLMTAASVAALPVLARRRSGADTVPVRAGVVVGVVLACAASCYAVALFVMPASWGHVLFGDTWQGIGILPALIAIQLAVNAFNQGAVLVLRAIGEAGRLLVARVILLPLGVVVGLIVAHVGGTVAIGLTLIAFTLLYGVVWWGIVLRVRRRLPAPLTEAVPA
jgi:hypothetical protein